MRSSRHQAASRRQLLRFLAASPLLIPGARALAQGLEGLARLPDPMIWAPQALADLIQRPEDAISVFDFEPVARVKVPPAHFGYLASGVDDEITLRANRSDFLKYELRPRRLRDVFKVDTGIELFGVKYASPIGIAPTGGNRAYDPEGDLAVARAAKAGDHLQALSTQSSHSIDDVMRARGGGVWFQLYASPSWEIARALIKRAEQAGSPVLAITVDRLASRNLETSKRMRRLDSRNCASCHDDSTPQGSVRTNPNFDGIDVAAAGVANLQSANMTWDFIKRVRDLTGMKIVIKGILTPEDAKLCVEHGADGLIVSNHGGRSEDGVTSTIGVLPEIVAAAAGRIPVLVDGGFRRGSDVVKALSIGAQAVFVGRPYLWGLGAFGQPGVEQVLAILRSETRISMGQCGAASVRDLVPALVRKVTA